jgi:dTMP kinase
MSDQQGTFIVIEGADGSGKTTQLELLRSKLIELGYDIVVFDFPRYNEPSSYFVREYLSGNYGSVDEVGPYTASLFYALDRYAAAKKIREALASGKVVLADRYVGSNMAHQGTKFRNVEERRGYFIWLDNLEFEMLGIPRPTMSFVLDAPFALSQKLLDKRVAETAIPRDIHEVDLNHLQKALTVFEDMCQLFPKDFVRIDTARNDELLSPEAVHSILWQKIVPLLPDRPKKAVASNAVTTEKVSASLYLERNDRGIYDVTPAGRQFLESVVTNADSNVFSFSDKLSPLLIASAMSQRTKRADDLRLLLLEDYAGAPDEQRVITKNSDETSKRLTGLYAIVENASSLLTKKIERHNIASYLELSSPYTYLDQRDSEGNFAYYIPPGLDNATTKHYTAHMDSLFEAYSVLVQRLTKYLEEDSVVPLARRNDTWHTRVRAEACQAASAVLPIATTTAVGVFASEEALEKLVMQLLSDALPEARLVGDKLLEELRKAAPNFLQGADFTKLEDTITYQINSREAVREIAEEHLAQNHGGGDPSTLKLVEVSPRNELELLPEMLYAASNIPLDELRQETSAWPYSRKLEAFIKYIGERRSKQQLPGRALEKAHYTWEVVADYSSFRAIQSYLSADPEWQMLTPRYGFAMPQLITDANLEDEFEACFDVSLQLYSLLQNKGYAVEAQYAALHGHKLRFTFTHTALEAFALHEQPKNLGNPTYQKIIHQMREKLSEVHPIIGETVKFSSAESLENSSLSHDKA